MGAIQPNTLNIFAANLPLEQQTFALAMIPKKPTTQTASIIACGRSGMENNWEKKIKSVSVQSVFCGLKKNKISGPPIKSVRRIG